MNRCLCAVVIWLWNKFFRLWGKMCAMQPGKIMGCDVQVSYHPYSQGSIERVRWLRWYGMMGTEGTVQWVWSYVMVGTVGTVGTAVRNTGMVGTVQ